MDVTAGGSGYSMPTVDFDYPDDPNGTQAAGHVVCVVDADGGGLHPRRRRHRVDRLGRRRRARLRLHHAPGVTILNGTQSDPITLAPAAPQATATSTLALSAVNVLEFGTGYTSAPTVDITDPQGTGTGASATAVTDGGAITAVTVDTPGEGYLTPGMRKFVDDLPMLCSPPACPDDG